MIQRQTLVLFCLVVCLSQPAWATDGPLLQNAIGNLKSGAQIDVTMLDGDRYLGDFAGVRSDSLLIRYHLSEKAPARSAALPLTNVARLRENRSGSGKGFKTGFTVGAVAGGSLGVLYGLALSSLGDGEVDAGAGFAGALMGGMVGGLGVGILGLGIGALSDAWYTIYEAPLAPSVTNLDEPGETRLTLGIGAASGHDKDRDFQKTGLYGQFGLQSPLGSHFELGPEIGYYDLDGTISHQEPGYYYVERTSPVLTFGLTGSYQSSQAGWSPYLIAGTGYYISGDTYLGVSFGGGLQYRTVHRQSFKLEIRDHVNIYSDDSTQTLDYFLTLGANFSFGL